MAPHTRADGKVRRSQVLTTSGPGALVDLVDHAVMLKGLDAWKYPTDEAGFIHELRLERQCLSFLRATGRWGKKSLRLRLPPLGDEDAPSPHRGIHAREFPSWYLCQRCNSLVQRPSLDDHRRHVCTDGPSRDNKPQPTVPIRFVTACRKGHVQDINWRAFVHHMNRDSEAPDPYWCEPDDARGKLTNAGGDRYYSDLQLVTAGTSGELTDLVVTCRRCGRSRGLQDMAQPKAFGRCSGWRPWLTTNEDCDEDARLLIRTGSNAWFPLNLSVLAIPEPQRDLKAMVERNRKHLEHLRPLSKLEQAVQLGFLPPHVIAEVIQWPLDEVAEVIERVVTGGAEEQRPIREVEWLELMSAEPGLAHDLPERGVDWHAVRLDDASLPDFIDRVVLVQALKEVRAQVGFLRLDGFPMGPEGSVEVDLQRVAPLSEHADWVPAVEIRGEGVFIAFDERYLRAWEGGEGSPVRRRAQLFRRALQQDAGDSLDAAQLDAYTSPRLIMLHSLAHMLIRAISLEAGYSASSIRERIYCHASPDPDRSRAGILLYTGTPGSEGTLGGLVDVGRHIVRHLRRAVDMNELCSNDPVCAQHTPVGREEGRGREGAACHGCLLIAEPSCERMNRDLDRAFVVPTVAQGSEDVAFLAPWIREERARR